jgi:hypothetical protein
VMKASRLEGGGHGCYSAVLPPEMLIPQFGLTGKGQFGRVGATGRTVYGRSGTRGAAVCGGTPQSSRHCVRGLSGDRVADWLDQQEPSNRQQVSVGTATVAVLATCAI